MRNTFARFLEEKLDQGLAQNLMLITGDLGFSVLESLQKKLGPSFINAGVAEALMTTLAASFAKQGMFTFTYSITPFATLRCLEQIRNDVAYHKANATVVSIGAGYAYGHLGPTHHCFEDFAALWSIPGMNVFSPADPDETRFCLETIWSQKGPGYLRLGKGGEPSLGLSAVEPVREILPGSSLTIVTSGSIAHEVKKAIQRPDIQLLTLPVVKPFPTKILMDKISSPNLLIIEELTAYSGFSGFLLRELALSGMIHRFKKIECMHAPDHFAKRVGTQDFLRNISGLSSECILSKINAFFLNH